MRKQTPPPRTLPECPWLCQRIQPSRGGGQPRIGQSPAPQLTPGGCCPTARSSWGLPLPSQEWVGEGWQAEPQLGLLLWAATCPYHPSRDDQGGPSSCLPALPGHGGGIPWRQTLLGTHDWLVKKSPQLLERGEGEGKRFKVWLSSQPVRPSFLRSSWDGRALSERAQRPPPEDQGWGAMAELSPH